MKSPDPYDASTTVPDVTVFFRRWRAWSDHLRAHTLHARDLSYGRSPDETLDLIVPHTGAPLIVFFHGGYWRRLHKDDATFVAGGFAPHGVATAIVNYGLAPAVRLEEIVMQARRAVAWLRANAKEHGADPSRIVVAGHSAGGQLAAMCAVDAPVAGIATLSGLLDLRPLATSFAQEWLQLDAARDIPERVAAFVSIRRGIVQRANAEAIEHDHDDSGKGCGHVASAASTAVSVSGFSPEV